MPISSTSPKLVILDRDGTINEDSDHFVKSPDEWIPLPGALQAIARLSQMGWQVVVATNQSGLGRGLFDIVALNAMHEKMKQLLAVEGGRIEAVFFCPHVASDMCHCRKPLPGLFEQIGERFRADLRDVPAVGDSLRDLQAAAAAGAQPHLVRTGKGQQTALRDDLPSGTVIHEDLSHFVDYWLQQQAQLNDGTDLPEEKLGQDALAASRDQRGV
ncbi:D-glycero-beta-D-manno-heptose-1,7-bisphosphate 7-phosphatase [Saezia sanguinis]|uniref:D-glycero-beta-D-manno-heptose-1,7-bisphosphate 7-phosphatase n=2 Tax=Saezia sanguinis TaxID=1965230 RepID=A0A433SCI4_9BURK|nr:D-glycero-beta-D-manno-heptose-1,7-bisphosphate 7-phosphatase [Saezia sanguinis]